MAHLTPEHIQHLYSIYGEIKVLDDIIRYRALDTPPTTILGYPKYDDRVDEYETFTGKQLDQFVDAAAKYFIKCGLEPNGKKVIAIFAPSDVSFVVTLFALSRLGYTVLCLSLRLAPVAIINLLRQTSCSTIIHGSQNTQIDSNLASVSQEVTSLNLLPIPARTVYRSPATNDESPFTRAFDRDVETHQTGLILHSSGSTGLPKPVFLTHRAALTHAVQGAGLHNFGALPLYHAYGLSTTVQAMYMGKTANLISATMPMTSKNLVDAVRTIKPEVIHGVPYALGLMVESQEGIEALRSARIVTAAGARTPDELGERLVREGVEFGVVFGTTEAGLLGDTMRRAPGDNTWNYVRIYPNIRPSIHMEPLGDGSFECIYLKSHPGLSTSDSDFPAPGSWRSKDVFVPHPTIPDVWKYVTRLDDRVTLSNGEKVLPLPIEGRIRQDDLVREAVIVGVDRAIPGVLLFRSDNQDAESLSEAEFVERVWLSIVDANASAEAFSQITREMVLVLSPGTEYPKTDKGSIIRAQVYRKFADQIEDMYTRLDRESSGTLRLDLSGVENFLADLYADMFGVELEDSHVDFFTAGVDSLQATQMRRKIQQALDLGGHQLGSNVVYEQGNIATLAKHLFNLSQGEAGQGSGNIALMKDLISKYSIFESSQVALLTGATGSLGAHILSQMIQSPKFHKVYCLVRGPNPMARILASIDERGLVLDDASLTKIVALTAEVHKSDLGVGSEQMALFRREVQCIVHLAWPVNFNIGLPSFEPHLEGLQNLIAFSVSVERPAPARLFFASSISTAESTPRPALIPDAPINDFSHALDMGYAQSKLAAEHIVLDAARNGARAYVLRIGQIVGDLQHGVWNDSEFIPSIIRSALSLGILPGLPDECSWLPVDTLATAILELDETLKADKSLSFSDDSIFYNMVNPLVFQWSELLEKLREAGLDFETISVREWVKELRNVAEKDGGVEAAQNPAVKLIHHFEQRYLRDGNAFAGNVVFDTKAVQRDTRVLQSPPDIIREGYVQSFIKTWMEKWAPEGPVLFNGAP